MAYRPRRHRLSFVGSRATADANETSKLLRLFLMLGVPSITVRQGEQHHSTTLYRVNRAPLTLLCPSLTERANRLRSTAILTPWWGLLLNFAGGSLSIVSLNINYAPNCLSLSLFYDIRLQKPGAFFIPQQSHISR